MSNVYVRDRKLSELEFYHTALKIRAEVNRLALKESVIPKRYRFTNAVPLIEMARSCVYNINRSDQFYPNSSQNVLERRRYLSLAIADAEQICLELQTLVEMGLPIDVNKLLPIAELVNTEISLLKGARKAVKLVGRRTADERINDLERELEALRAV